MRHSLFSIKQWKKNWFHTCWFIGLVSLAAWMLQRKTFNNKNTLKKIIIFQNNQHILSLNLSITISYNMHYYMILEWWIACIYFQVYFNFVLDFSWLTNSVECGHIIRWRRNLIKLRYKWGYFWHVRKKTILSFTLTHF